MGMFTFRVEFDQFDGSIYCEWPEVLDIDKLVYQPTNRYKIDLILVSNKKMMLHDLDNESQSSA